MDDVLYFTRNIIRRGRALGTITEEMGYILYWISFSSIVQEVQNLDAELFNADFDTLCESVSTPLRIGLLPGNLATTPRRLELAGGRGEARGHRKARLSPQDQRLPSGRQQQHTQGG